VIKKPKGERLLGKATMFSSTLRWNW